MLVLCFSLNKMFATALVQAFSGYGMLLILWGWATHKYEQCVYIWTPACNECDVFHYISAQV